MIFTVNNIFHDLNVAAQGNLEEGVQAIEEQERQQEEARRTITDFSNEMKRVAEVLRGFGASMPGSVGLAKREHSQAE